jgi:hypothetical protein
MLAVQVDALLRPRPSSWLTRPIGTDGDFLVVPPVTIVTPRWRAIRVDDMLLFDVSLHGLSIQADPDGPVLERNSPDAILIVHFQPQAVGEEAFDDSSTTDDPSPLWAGALPAEARHAGPSRLAFRMPTGVETLPFTSAGVLRAMADWPLAVVPRGIAGGGLSDLGIGIADVIAEVAKLLPAASRKRVSEATDRSARRAVASIGPSITRDAVDEAAESAALEVESATRHLDLTEAQRRTVRIHADLAVASKLIDREGARVGVGGIVGLLPGLAFLYRPRKPPDWATAIELPYRLIQSPDEDGAFSHAQAIVAHGPRTELWHTRLGVRADGLVVDATDTVSTLAAIWSPDYGQPPTSEPGFQTSLSAQDRDEIVRLTADETGHLPGRRRSRYVPVPARARRMMLTALGGWLDEEGNWASQPANVDELPLSLVAWEHHAALGRDWFVKTVRTGRALPLGHRMVYLEITERRFQSAPGRSGPVAVLRKRRFVEIVEPSRTYPDATQPFDGRDLPFTRIEILTKRSPNLLPPAPGETVESFWPRIAGSSGPEDFRFAIRATDIAGNVVRFDLPLRFVSQATPVGPAVSQYNGGDQTISARTTAPLRGQVIQLAPTATRTDAMGAPDPGDVEYPIDELRFGAALPTVAPPPGSPLARFHPAFRTVGIISTSLAQLTGETTPGEMAYALQYKNDGFGSANKAELFLTATTSNALTADFATRSSSDKAGGIVTPNYGVTGASRAFGLVGGDTDLLSTSGTFDPNGFFPHAKLFGGIDLKDILAPVAVALAGAAVPKMKTTRTREKMETTFELKADHVNSVPLLRVNERGTSTFSVKGSMISWFKVADPSVAPIGSGPGAAGGNDPGLKDPEVNGEGTLTWFKLNFFGCIIVSFDSFTFKGGSSAGVDVDAKVADKDGVVFGGPLAFVNGLTKTLGGNKPTSGGGGGGGSGGGGGGGLPGFKVTPIFKPSPTGLTVGVKLGLTKLPLGVFTLKNLMVSNAVTLPFDGTPLSYKFGFAERSNPFQLVVSLFGGGGFLVLGLDTEDGVREIEAALEFGAFAELDFGVASGAIYVKAGIYYYWNKTDKTTTLKGYVEMGGEVQVLGIISVSILMHLSLGYYKVGTVSEVRGQATLVIEIELLFFSTSVNLTVERRFGGAEADPTFQDLIPTKAVWAAYADAFA